MIQVRFLIMLASLFTAAPTFAAEFVYVSVAGEKRIAIYRIDSNDGSLTNVGNVSTAGEPGALTSDPNRRFLFAALHSTGELAAFRIDPSSGKLTHINTVPAGADPAHIAVDKQGKFLLTAYYVAGQVTVHGIADDGSLSKSPRQTFKTKEKAHAVVFNSRHNAILVPHTGPNVIDALIWFEDRGEITRLFFRTEFETPRRTGPRHAVFHPSLEIRGGVDADAEVAYVVNEQGSSVAMYHAILNPINWQLQSKQTISTLPADFKGINACAEIRLHPTNRFLYVSNRGHDSIAAFEIDNKTGQLASLGQTPTEATPRSFDISPSGKFLFAAGEASGKLATYRINDQSGKLDRLATHDIGKSPWWVMAIPLPEAESGKPH
jgi:6-phosphogluconolactonase (cycloisomerase 2 family)